MTRRQKFPAPLADRPAVARQLIETRLLLGLTQRDLASLLSIDRVTIALAESGRRKPSRALTAWLDSQDGAR